MRAARSDKSQPRPCYSQSILPAAPAVATSQLTSVIAREEEQKETPEVSLKIFLWGTIDSVEAAKASRIPLLFLSIFRAFLWFILTVPGLFVPNVYGYWDIAYTVLFLLISWGLYKMRKEAAVGALVIALYGLFVIGDLQQFLSNLFMLHFAVCATRGIFAYARFNQSLKRTGRNRVRFLGT